jgi:F-type H+-transporting ATPase subunit epsilon
MGANFQLTIRTPIGLVWEGEVESVVVPGTAGSYGILAGHAPMIGTLGKGLLRVKTGTTERSFRVEGGILEVRNNAVVAAASSAVAEG